jgi:hypothetical protein
MIRVSSSDWPAYAQYTNVTSNAQQITTDDQDFGSNLNGMFDDACFVDDVDDNALPDLNTTEQAVSDEHIAQQNAQQEFNNEISAHADHYVGQFIHAQFQSLSDTSKVQSTVGSKRANEEEMSSSRKAACQGVSSSQGTSPSSIVEVDNIAHKNDTKVTEEKSDFTLKLKRQPKLILKISRPVKQQLPASDKP